jgi:phage-related minor tail protein
VFASGGVIGTPSYFPMPGGGTGLAGEAGPEAIMPLQRAADGSLGVAAQGVSTPSMCRSRCRISTASVVRRAMSPANRRAVARGQRSL